MANRVIVFSNSTFIHGVKVFVLDLDTERVSAFTEQPEFNESMEHFLDRIMDYHQATRYSFSTTGNPQIDSIMQKLGYIKFTQK